VHPAGSEQAFDLLAGQPEISGQQYVEARHGRDNLPPHRAVALPCAP
jgi:hypothetical protein